MAVEKDFELLDDYLSNRLSGEDKVAFESTLNADPELARELKVQQHFVDGIKNVRSIELKTMLNSIPVTAIQTGTGTSSILTKVGTWIVVAGVITTSAYFYFTDNETEPIVEQAAIEQPQVETIQAEPKEQEAIVLEEPINEKPDPVSNEITNGTTSEVKKPTLEVFDPAVAASEDAVLKYEHDQLEVISKAFVTSSIEVDVEHADRKYTFHYMFKTGKLVLFGAFDAQLYEILEFISGEKRTVVLFYEANYYLLDIEKSEPTQLLAIRDRALLKKLKEYRGK